MVFYKEKQQQHLETDASGVSLGGYLLQGGDGMQYPRNEALDDVTLWPMAFASKSLTSMKTCYNNTESEALGILHGLKNFTTAALPRK